ncbi:MAG: hypothetical protein ACKOB8_00905 [Mycobacterium sp.]
MTLRLADPAHRQDLVVFVERALRMDEAAVIRLRTRNDGLVGVWVSTGLGVLAGRVVAGGVRPADLSCGADLLLRGLRGATGSTDIDPGPPMHSGWRGALPPEAGFVHLDDVPAHVVGELARSGAELARQHRGPVGPAASLLDQEVLQVNSGATGVAVPMRCVLALAAMGFLPEPAGAGDVVRVRALPGWLRLDARFGSVFRRRGDPALLL